MMYFEIAVSLLLLWILYRFINLCRVQMATGGFSKITDRRSLKSTSSCVPTSTSKKCVTEDWSSVRRSCGLNNDTVKERKGCKSPVLASTEDDLTSVGHCRRRLLHNSLEDPRNTAKLTARYVNEKLAAELLQAFPKDIYTVEDHCLEEEGGSEVLEAVTVSTTDNLQDQVLICCKPYIVALKTGTMDFDKTGDQLFDFVGEAMEMMDAGNYKGALLLLPEQTFLPRYLAEKLQQKGDIFTLRHTDGFVRDVVKYMKKVSNS
ncbi:uncharacterized protein LOC118422069 [Branchiostoma floridae]|uniref:Uncharacterized protein LOC118422069 n=1 Tax=Branchiostoma floridae TaxID=7739 RepID=A0A9J7N0E7_BRAFL|nr:uncharacterized protein LOC118422069 [Branchiostoma floridae]